MVIISGRVRWVGACSTHGRDEKCIKILSEKPEMWMTIGRLKRK